MLDRDDARTDVILAAATALFGGALRALATQLPGYPRGGIAAVVLELAWLFALTGLVPVLLARHRGEHVTAWGQGQGGIGPGVLLAAVILAAHLLTAAVLGVAPLAALAGRLSGPAGGVVVNLAWMVVATAGSWLLLVFLALRGAWWGNSPDRTLTALLRTVGMSGAGIAAIAGAARSVGTTGLRGTAAALIAAAAAAGLVLVTDRFVSARRVVARTSVATPVVVVALVHLFASGGIFGGDLVAALHTGGLAVAVTTVVATLVHAKVHRAAPLALLAAAHLWPTCLSPLAVDFARAC